MLNYRTRIPCSNTKYTKRKFKKRRRKTEGNHKDYKLEITDIMKHIITYLWLITKNFDDSKILTDKDGLIKILNFLQSFKMENPIIYLKVPSINVRELN